jgi:hypothetical protein
LPEKPGNSMEEKIRAENHRTVSVTKQTFSKAMPEKPGFLKRFLDWIAKGAKEANMGAQSCPS